MGAGRGDPKVTGVLPVALASATKLIGLIMHSVKEYVALMELHREVDPSRVEEVLRMFVGKIYQKPPLRSSVKRSLRVREIYEIEILEIEGRHVLFRVRCQSGTYIRKLCHDVGLILGVEAHMRELRRIATAHFREDMAVTLHELSEALFIWRELKDDSFLRKRMLPAEAIVAHLPKIVVKDSAVDAIAHGAQLAAPGVVKLHEGISKGDLVALMTMKGELIAVARAEMSTEEILQASRGIVATPQRVFMEPGTYPRMWKRKGGESGEARS